ncbi:MAG: hypothetical protein DWI29_01155 [Planctomycetota bacterium]|nr:MAG: hypothetical protein DWI29_01155 [Planctomycetota bacterium]
MQTAEKVYAMLGNEQLWHAAAQCHQILANANISHTVCGGVAVCLHGYQRNTVDLDLIIEPERAADVRLLLAEAGLTWDAAAKEFRTNRSIAVQFLMTGDRAGNDSEVRLPAPTGDLNVEVIDGLPVLRLSRLIEIKIACGLGSIRRTHKDFADVVELIAIRKLDGSFARHLHKSVRSTFRKLVRNAQGGSSRG